MPTDEAAFFCRFTHFPVCYRNIVECRSLLCLQTYCVSSIYAFSRVLWTATEACCDFGFFLFTDNFATSPANWSVAERKNFKLLFSVGIIFGRWSFDFIFSTNEDGLCHSVRITFPGNIKKNCVTLSLPLFLTDLSSRRTISTRRKCIQHLGHCSLRRPFLYHLFLPPRPTGPRTFWLNA